MSKDFVWNENDAEQVRYESEKALREQIDNMRATEQVYKGWLPTMDAQAREEERIAATAMKSVRTRNGWELRPDWQRREEARNRANSLREQIGLTGNAISNINRAIQGLQDAIDETNRHFWRMRNEAQATDRDFSRHVQIIDDDIATFISKMQETHDSFSEDGFTEHQRLAFLGYVIKAAALNGTTQIGKHILNMQKRNVNVGRSFSSKLQSRNALGRFGSFPTRAHSEGAKILRNISNSRWSNIGRGMRITSPIINPLISTVRHYIEHGDIGQALMYATFIGGGSTLAGGAAKVAVGTTGATGIAGVAVKLWPLLVVGATGYGLHILYESNKQLRMALHDAACGVSVVNWTSYNNELGIMVTLETPTCPDVTSYSSDKE